MTQREINLVAEAVVKKLQQTNPWFGEEILSAKDIAKRLGMSESFVSHNPNLFERIDLGGCKRYLLNRSIDKLTKYQLINNQ